MAADAEDEDYSDMPDDDDDDDDEEDVIEDQIGNNENVVPIDDQQVAYNSRRGR